MHILRLQFDIVETTQYNRRRSLLLILLLMLFVTAHIIVRRILRATCKSRSVFFFLYYFKIYLRAEHFIRANAFTEYDKCVAFVSVLVYGSRTYSLTL